MLEGQLAQLDTSLFNFVDFPLLVSGWYELELIDMRPSKPPDGHPWGFKVVASLSPQCSVDVRTKEPALVFLLHPLRER